MDSIVNYFFINSYGKFIVALIAYYCNSLKFSLPNTVKDRQEAWLESVLKHYL